MIRCAAAWLLLSLFPLPGSADWLDFWLTPDQQGQRLYQQEQFADAAARFTTPERIGAALFRAGMFEPAAAVLGRSSTPEAAYNRGNALIMLGRYEDAISSYHSALERRPGWAEAEQNLEIARLRQAALAPPEDDYGGTGGKLEADEIVMDTTGRTRNSSAEEIVQESDQSLSDDALRALWLRRVQTRPGDFLAAKFTYQLAAGSQAEAGDE